MKIKSFLAAIFAVATMATASAQSTMTVADGEYKDGEQTNLSVVLDNQNEFTGFQFLAEYPEGWTVKVVRGANIKVKDDEEEYIYSAKYGDNHVYLVYTMAQRVLESGEVAIVQVTPTGEGELKLTGVTGADAAGEKTLLDDIVVKFASGVATGLESINVENTVKNAYNLAGQRTNAKGLVISNGKVMFVK